MTQGQRELAETLRSMARPSVGGPTGAYRSTGSYWAICAAVADNQARHDPAFDRPAFLTLCMEVPA